MMKAYPSDPDGWKARSDMQTLIESKKIKMDPKRLKAALECARREKETLEELTEYAPQEK